MALTVVQPEVGGTGNANLTFPNTTGTVMVSGNNPTFYAYRNSDYTITSSTWTKVPLNAELFDTANAFDSTTNYRFQPTVAGYYQLNGNICLYSPTSLTRAIVAIKKNSGTLYVGLDFGTPATYDSQYVGTVSLILYFNGSTDYAELWGYIYGNTPLFAGSNTGEITYLNGTLVRNA